MATTPRPIDKLVLVYNADSGALSALADSARKLFRLNGCTLCSITHGLAGEKSEWRDCQDTLGVPVDYLHRDELDVEMSRVVDGQLPCVVAEVGGERIRLLGPDVLDRCKGSVADFRGRLTTYAAMHDLALD